MMVNVVHAVIIMLSKKIIEKNALILKKISKNIIQKIMVFLIIHAIVKFQIVINVIIIAKKIRQIVIYAILIISYLLLI